MKKILTEKYIRKTLRRLLLESHPGVGPAKAKLMANKKNFGNPMMLALKSDATAREATHILIRGKIDTTDVGDIFKHLIQFENDFIAFLNVLEKAGGGAGSFTISGQKTLEEIFANLVASIGGKMPMPMTDNASRGKINKAIILASEGGTGIGTYDDKVELAFNDSALKHVLDLPYLNADYPSDARKALNFRLGDAEDMWRSLCEEGYWGALAIGAGDLNPGEQIDHIVRPLLENQPFVSFKNSEDEPVQAQLTDIVQTFYDNIPDEYSDGIMEYFRSFNHLIKFIENF